MAQLSPSASVVLAVRSTTADSDIGTPAALSDPGDRKDGGASVGQPSAPGSEAQTDITAVCASPATPSTDNSKSSRSGRNLVVEGQRRLVDRRLGYDDPPLWPLRQDPSCPQQDSRNTSRRGIPVARQFFVPTESLPRTLALAAVSSW